MCVCARGFQYTYNNNNKHNNDNAILSLHQHENDNCNHSHQYTILSLRTNRKNNQSMSIQILWNVFLLVFFHLFFSLFLINWVTLFNCNPKKHLVRSVEYAISILFFCLVRYFILSCPVFFSLPPQNPFYFVFILTIIHFLLLYIFPLD